jgi:hypothetical protein
MKYCAYCGKENEDQAVIPDQFLMQNVGFNLNTYGYVRIQVSPKDYEAAKEVLSGREHGA